MDLHDHEYGDDVIVAAGYTQHHQQQSMASTSSSKASTSNAPAKQSGSKKGGGSNKAASTSKQSQSQSSSSAAAAANQADEDDKKKRSSKACDACRKAKRVMALSIWSNVMIYSCSSSVCLLRCKCTRNAVPDGTEDAQCQNCKANGIDCTFLGASKKR